MAFSRTEEPKRQPQCSLQLAKEGEREVPVSSPWKSMTRHVGMVQSSTREGFYWVGKYLFTVRVVKQCNRLPSEVVDALCLSVSKRHLDNALTNML